MNRTRPKIQCDVFVQHENCAYDNETQEITRIWIEERLCAGDGLYRAPDGKRLCCTHARQFALKSLLSSGELVSIRKAKSDA
jgi:hypothetical protein